MPLRRASDLVQRPIVQYLVAASGSLLGEVSRMLNTAAEQAIRDGSERVSLQHLEQALSKRFRPKADRKMIATTGDRYGPWSSGAGPSMLHASAGGP